MLKETNPYISDFRNFLLMFSIRFKENNCYKTVFNSDRRSVHKGRL